MNIPIIKIKALLDNLLGWVVDNYNASTDPIVAKKDTWLYDTFYGEVQGNFNFYNEILGILMRDKKNPDRLETRMMYDKNRANIPTIHIHMPSESNGGFNSLGSGYGNEVTKEVDLEYGHFSRSFESFYELIITGASTYEILAMYELLKALFLAGASTIQNDFEVFEYSGKELMANPDLIPYSIFYRSFAIKVKYEQVVKSIEGQGTGITSLQTDSIAIPNLTPATVPPTLPSYNLTLNDLANRITDNEADIVSLNNLIQLIPIPPTSLSELAEDENHRTVTDVEIGAWNGKQEALGFTPENVSNKKTTLTNNDTDYPTSKVVTTELGKKQDSIKFTPEAEPGSFASWVRGVLLTGLGAFTNFAILAEDTLLAAMAKLQGQINSLVTRVGKLEDNVIADITITEPVSVVDITTDKNGNPLFLKEVDILIMNGQLPNNSIRITVNNITDNVYFSYAYYAYAFFMSIVGLYGGILNGKFTYDNKIERILFDCYTNAKYSTTNYTTYNSSGFIDQPATPITSFSLRLGSGSFPTGTRIILKNARNA